MRLAGERLFSEWDELLSGLTEGPRENGTPSLRASASFIAEQLESAGVEARFQEFSAHPYDPVALGVIVFALCVAYWWALRSRRTATALVVALLLIGIPVAHLDWQVPLTPGISSTEANVLGVIPAEAPRRRLILAAHYDSKTELTDHVLRLPVQVGGAVLGIIAVVLPLVLQLSPRTSKRGRLSRAVGGAALVYGVVFVALFSAGSLLPARSSGALDNGAACAVLLRAAALLAEGPPLQHTEVMFAFFAAEEVGAQGSWSFVRGLPSQSASTETYVVNLDPIGASSDLTIVHRESALLRSYAPDSTLVEILDSVHRRKTGQPINHTRGGGLTDAFPFLASGMRAATVISAVPPFVLPRGMHTPADDRSRIDLEAMSWALDFVLELSKAIDDMPRNSLDMGLAIRESALHPGLPPWSSRRTSKQALGVE